MDHSMSVAELIRVIEKLPSDQPVDDPRVWYKTQKEHWLGWLRDYDGPGAYGRQPGRHRDAKFAYNHVVNPYMLLYLIDALEMPPDVIAYAELACERGKTLMEKSGLIRKIVPWSVVHTAIEKRKTLTYFDQFMSRE
jgi:hypothetical protein